MDLQTLRGMFSLVLQDVHLFSGTIAANIRLGNAVITDEPVAARRRGGARRRRSSSGCRMATTSAGRRARGDAVGRAEAAAVVRAGAGFRSARS